jgi:hypothetical protein
MENSPNGKSLPAMIDQFQKLVDSCPSQFNARLRTLSEKRDSHLYLELRCSFKLVVDGVSDASELECLRTRA